MTLANRLGFDTISGFRQSARERFTEAELLAGHRNPFGAIYLYGYSVEMIIKAAYFRALGHGPTQEIKPSDRGLAKGHATDLGIRISGPHDFVGWALLLVEFNGSLPRPTYDEPFGSELVNRAIMAYRNWRPEMRYRVAITSPQEVEAVRSSACWFLRNDTYL